MKLELLQSFRLIFTLVFTISTLPLLSQQAGSLDLTFNPNDVGFGAGDAAGGICVAIQPDGKILAGNYIFQRLNTDGTIDSTFANGPFFDNAILDAELQNDGKIITCGRFEEYNGTSRNSIARLNLDGTLDTLFNPGTGFDSWAFTTFIQSDGKILVGGQFQTFNGVSTGCVARLNSDGSRDTSFQSLAALPFGYIYRFAVQPDGKILVGGIFSYNNGPNGNIHLLIRLNPDGTYDNTFNIGTGFNTNGEVRGILVQPDGKILVAGHLTVFNGTSMPHSIIRLNQDGSPDTTFVPDGFSGGSTNWDLVQICQQADGRIIAVGGFTHFGSNPSRYIIRINNDGSYDSTFIVGAGFNLDASDVILQQDGKIVVTGDFNMYDTHGSNKIIRLNYDGTRDSSFLVATGINGFVQELAVLPSGKILAGGAFSSFNNEGVFNCALLNPDGSMDTTFKQYYFGLKIVSSMAVQDDGKFVLRGDINNPYSPYGMARLYPNGNFDSTYVVPAQGTFSSADPLTIQPFDQKIIVSRAVGDLQRLNPDGSLDSVFISGIYANDWINVIQVQPDHSILIGGKFTTVKGMPFNRIARLMPDGNVDTTFNIGTGIFGNFYEVNNLAIQDDGKIILVGKFNNYNGHLISNIVRINSDGTYDSTFMAGTGILGYKVETILIQPDGKIVVGGQFTSFNVYVQKGLVRLNQDGTLDTGFNTGTGFPDGDGPYSIGFTSDWKIVAGGGFTSYNGTGRNRILKIHATETTCNTPPAGIQLSVSGNQICQGDSVTLYRVGGVIPSGGSFKWYSGSCGGTLIGTGDSIRVAPLSNTLYTVRAESSCGNSPCAIKTVFVSAPVVNIFATGSTSFCLGDSVLLSATPGFTSWQWHRQFTTITPSNTPDLYAKTRGGYFCVATDVTGCTDTSNVIIVKVPCMPPIHPPGQKSITSSEDANSIVVYPNPSFATFNIEVICDTEISIPRLFHINGKEILPDISETSKGVFLIHNVEPGIYVIMTSCGQTVQFSKFIQLE